MRNRPLFAFASYNCGPGNVAKARRDVIRLRGEAQVARDDAREVAHGDAAIPAPLGEVGDGDGVLVRMHSKCLTGDVFHSMRCDCGWQLETAMAQVAAAELVIPPRPHSIRMLLDSALGAGVQGRFHCDRCHLPSERRVHRCGKATRPVGGLSWLSNDGVNAVASLAATAAGWAAF